MKRFFLCFFLFKITAQDDLKSQWESDLKYGIDKTVKNTIDKMIELKDYSLYTEVKTLFKDESNNLDLKTTSINYFIKRFKEEETQDEDIRENIEKYIIYYTDYPVKLVTVSLKYIQAMNIEASDELYQALLDLLEDKALELNIESIKTLKETSFTRKDLEEILLNKFDTSDKIVLKSEILKALGKINKEAGINLINDIAEDENENKSLRYAAIDSLKYLKNENALDLIKLILDKETDSNIKSKALYALKDFPIEETKNIIISGFRDSAWQVRKASIEVSVENNITEALDYFDYMLKKDPEKNILETIIFALNKFDNPKVFEILKERLEDDNYPVSLKALMIKEILKSDANPFLDILNNIIEKNWNLIKSPDFSAIVDTLASESENNNEDLYRTLLRHPDKSIRNKLIKGITINNLTLFKEDLEKLKEKVDSKTKKEIEYALTKM